MDLSTIVNSEFIHYGIICMNKQKRGDFFVNYYQRLKDLREDRDLKQSDIAKILDIGQSDYSKYERGVNMMGIDKYIKLAQYYNISLDYLTGLTSTPRALNGEPYKISKNINITNKGGNNKINIKQ